MNKVFKMMLIFLLIIINMLLISCEGGRELDSIGIVIAIGFDLDGEDIIITNEVINPMGASPTNKNNNQEASKFVMGRGKTMEEAISNISLTFDRQLYYSHTRIIILGEDVVKGGYGEYIDTFNRNNQIRETTPLMVAKDAKAYEIMGIMPGIAHTAGKYIYDITKDNMITGKQRVIDINRFFRDFYGENEDYVLGVVERINKKVIKKESEDDKDNSKENKGDTLEVLRMEGGAVLKDKKLIGYFTGEEMMGFNFILDEFEGGVVSFITPKDALQESVETYKEKPYSGFKIFKSRTKTNIILQGDKLHLFINLKLRGGLKGTQEGVNLNNRLVIKKMEKSIEKNIRDKISKTLKKSQKQFEMDVLGIGQLVHRSYPNIWKEIKDEWPEIFKDLDYTIRVDASINDVGFASTTQGIRKSIYEK